MGTKHNKKRYCIVRYQINKDGKWDELVELSKKKIGAGKINDSDVVLDLVNEELLKYDIPGAERGPEPPYENVHSHFHKYYGKLLDQFIK